MGCGNRKIRDATLTPVYICGGSGSSGNAVVEIACSNGTVSVNYLTLTDVGAWTIPSNTITVSIYVVSGSPQIVADNGSGNLIVNQSLSFSGVPCAPFLSETLAINTLLGDEVIIVWETVV